MLVSRTELHVFDATTVKAYFYRDDDLKAFVRLFLSALCSNFMFIDDKAITHRDHIIND